MYDSSPARPAALLLLAPLALLALSCLAACTGWTVDYGRPAAQFEAVDAGVLAVEHLGDKVSVRGKVKAVDTSDPEHCVVELEGGVTARFGDFKQMAEACEVGEVVYVDGIVAAADSTGVILDRAVSRDPTATFEPKRP